MFNNYRLSFKFFIYLVLFSLFLPFFYNLALSRLFRKSVGGDIGNSDMKLRFNDEGDHEDKAGFSEKIDPHDHYHKSVKKELRSDKYMHDFHDFHDENNLMDGGDMGMENLHQSLPNNYVGVDDMHGKIPNLLGDDDGDDKILTASELSDYNGEMGSKGLYIAILGDVYDVKKGDKHYGPGGSYNFFAGRDASKSFITGEFTKVTDDMDDVLSLQPRDILSLFQWKEFYDKEYKYKGKVIGRFYNGNGHETEYYAKIKAMQQEAIYARDNELKLENLYPPCNIEWKAETGTRVWCTKMSGGIKRDWEGVPRKYFQTAEHNFRCACINTEHRNSANLLEYETCDPESTECYYKVD